MPKPAEDLTGRTFGRLTVLRRGSNGPRGDVRWVCVCSCHPERETRPLPGFRLRSPSPSCGCLALAKWSANGRALVAWRRKKLRKLKCSDCGVPFVGTPKPTPRCTGCVARTVPSRNVELRCRFCRGKFKAARNRVLCSRACAAAEQKRARQLAGQSSKYVAIVCS